MKKNKKCLYDMFVFELFSVIFDGVPVDVARPHCLLKMSILRTLLGRSTASLRQKVSWQTSPGSIRSTVVLFDHGAEY